MSDQHISTQCLHAGYNPGNGEPRNIPIIQSTTFRYATSEDMGKLFDLEASGYFYTRLQNPTSDAVAAKICALEGGSAASFQVENGRVVQFTLRFRSYAAGDQNTLLLPQRQAMAVLQQAGGSGRELRLVCVDQGGETAALQWAAGEED